MVLSGIQLSQTSILVEIQKLAFYLLENVSENKQIISGPIIPGQIISGLYDVPLSEVLLSDVSKFLNWNVFEFVTKKTGAAGPTKTECIRYYKEK